MKQYLLNVALLLLIFCVCVSSSVATRSSTEICGLLRSFSSFKPNADPDYLVGLDDLSWVSTACQSLNTNDTEWTFSTGWLESKTIKPTFLPSQLSTINTNILRNTTFSYNMENDTIYLEVTFSINSIVKGKVDVINVDAEELIYTFKKSTRDYIDFSSLSFSPISWEGSLTSNSCNASNINSFTRTICFFDSNLFDGSKPVILAIGNSTNDVENGLSQEITSSFMYLATQFGVNTHFTQISPYSFSSPSVRGVFLDSSMMLRHFTNATYIPKSKLFDYEKNVFFSNQGELYQLSVECIAENCLGSTIEALKELLEESTRATNCSISFERAKSSLTAAIFITDTSIHPLAYSGYSEGFAFCRNINDSAVSVRIAVRATPVNEIWPVKLYTQNAKSASTLLRSIPLSLNGYISGKIHYNGDLYYSYPSNIYSSLPNSGVFIRDLSINTKLIHNVMGKVRNSLFTNVSVLDQYVLGLMSETNVDSIIADYSSGTMFPTFIGFFKHFSEKYYDSIRFLIKNDTESTVEVSIICSNKESINITDYGISSINSQLEIFRTKVLEKYPELSNLKTNTISEVTLLSKQLFTGAVTSMIHITGFSTEDVSVFVGSQLDYSASLYLKANFEQSLFSEIYASHDYKTNSSAIKGKITRNGEAFFVGLSEGNVIVGSSPAGVSFMKYSDAISILSSRVDSIPNINRTIPLISNVLTLVTDKFSIENMLIVLAAKLRSTQQANTIEVSAVIEEFLYSFCFDYGCSGSITANVSPKDGSNLGMSLSIVKMQHLHIVENNLEMLPITPTVGVSSLIRMDTFIHLSLINPSFESFTIKGKGELDNWAVPFRYNMQSGRVLQSFISFDINMPSYVNFEIIMGIEIEHNNESIFFNFKSGNLLLSNNIPSIQFSGDGQDSFVPPQNVMYTLKDVFKVLTPIKNGPLNFKVPFLTDDFNQFVEWDGYVDTLTDMLLYPKMLRGSDPLVSFTLAEEQTLLDDLNITINGIIYHCAGFSIDNNSTNTTINSFNRGLEKCNLGSILCAKEFKNEVSDFLIGIFPFNHYGIYQMELKFSSNIRAPQFFEYQVPFYPIFSSWSELSWLLHITTNEVLKKPVVSTVDRKFLPIPEEMQNVYPAQFKTISVDFTLKNNVMKPSTFVKFLEDSGSKISLETTGTANVHNNIQFNGKYGYVFSIPGLYNITLLTNADSNFTIYKNITELGSSFSMSIKAQLRTATETKTVTSNLHISLPIGRNFSDIMMNWLPEQVDYDIRPMFFVDVNTGSEILGTQDQIQITLRRVMLETDKFLVPLSLFIYDSNVPIISMTSQIPPTSLPISSEISITSLLNLTSNDDLSLKSGSLGLFGVKPTSEMDGSGIITLALNLPDEHVPLYKLMRATTDISLLFDLFDITIATDNSLSVQNPTMNINSSIPRLNTMSVVSKKSWKINSQSILDNIASVIHNLEAKFDSVEDTVKETYYGLSQTNASSLCSFLDEIMKSTNDLGRKSVLQTPLPFVKKTFKHLLERAIVDKFQSAKQSVCNGIVEFSLEKFCDLLEHRWGQKVCYDSLIADKSFIVTLKLMNYELVSNEELFVEPNIFGTTKIPAIMGMEDSVSLNSNANFEIRIKCSWKDGFVFDILDGTTFYISSDFAVNGNMKASLGPINLMLGSANVFVGKPAVLSATLVNGLIDLSLTGNAGFNSLISFFDLSSCQLSIDIPDIAKFLGGSSNSLVIDQHTCKGGSFVNSVTQILKDHTLLDFFKDPSTFLNQFQNHFSDLLKKIFDGPNGLLNNVVVPVVDKEIQKILQKELGSIIGPEMTNDLTNSITVMVNSVISGKSVTGDELTRVILTEFTQIMCQKFKPVECPKVPDIHSAEYVWGFELKRVLKHGVANLGFDMGSSAKGTHLTSEVELDFEMDYKLRFNLVFSKSNGASITFNEGYVLEGITDLKLDGTQKVEGEIGFLGAEIILDPTSSFHAEFGVDNQWKAFMKANSILTGKAEMGFAGIITKLLKNVEDPLDALPHFESIIEFKWNWEMGTSSSTTPEFSLSEPSLCIGTLLSRMAEGVRKQAEKVIGNLDKIVGPASFLTKDVGVLSRIFGREMSIAELGIFLARHYCSGECDAVNVEELISAYKKLHILMNKLQVVRNFLSTMNGCGIRRKFSKFVVDLQKSDDPIIHDVPDQALIFEQDIPPSMKPEIEQTFSMIQSRTYNLHIPLFEEPKKIPSALIGLMLGKDFNLVEIEMPKMVLSFSAHFGFPIWAFPYVELYIQASAGLVVDLPTIAYTTKGIRDAVQTKKITNLFKGVGMITRKPDGSPIWIVSGYVRLTGGVSFIFSGNAYAFLEAEARVTVLDINGNQVVTFDELFYLIQKNGIQNTVTFEMQLSAGFGFNIKACIKVWFAKKCWTIVSQEIKVPIFPKLTFGGKRIAPVADRNSNLNLDYVNEFGSSNSDKPVFIVYPSTSNADRHTIGFSPSSSMTTNLPPLSFPNQGTNSVAFYGNAGGKPFEIKSLGYQGLVTVPPLNTVTSRIPCDSYRNTDSFTISPTFITPNNYLGLQYTPGMCSQAILENVKYGTKFNLQGTPCHVVLNAAYKSQIEIGTDSQNYKGPVTINGPGELTFSVPSPKYHVTSSSISIDGSSNLLRLENDMPSITVVGDNQPTSFSFSNIVKTSAITALGSESDDEFLVSDVTSVYGGLMLNGGSGINRGTFIIPASSDNMNIMITSSSLSIDNTNTIRWANLDHRSYRVLNRNNHTNIKVSYFSPDDFNSFHVETENNPTGVIYHNISSCSTRNEIRLDLKGGGEQVVLLSQNGEFSPLQCSMYIQGVDGQNSGYTILIDATNEKRNLRYSIENGRVTVDDPDNTDFMTNLYIRQISRVKLIVSEKQYSDIKLVQGAPNTEYHFQFAENTTDYGVKKPTLTLCNLPSKSTTLVTGSADINLGPKTGICSNKFINPLENLRSLIVVAGQNSKVTMNSGNDGSQHFNMTDRCLFATDDRGVSLVDVDTPTPWMQQLLLEYGFNRSDCHIAYYPQRTSFEITTGKGDDSFYGRYVTASSIDINLGEGRDTIFYGETATPANFKTERGASKFVQVSPTGPINLSMKSSTTERNIIDFFTGDLVSSMTGNTVIYPTGPNPYDYSTISCSSSDLITLHHSFPLNYDHSTKMSLFTTRAINQDIVYINVTEISTSRQVELRSDTKFIVSLLGWDSTIVFLGTNQQGEYAKNFVIELNLDISSPGRIFIDTISSTNGELVVNVPNYDAQSFPLRIASLGPVSYGFLSIGVLRVETLGMNHVTVNSPSTRVSAVIENTPSTMEVVLNLRPLSTVDLQGLGGLMIISNAAVTVSRNYFIKPSSVMVVGSSSVTVVLESDTSYLNDRCMNIQGILNTRVVASEWFAQIMQGFNIPSTAVSCPLYLFRIPSLDFTGPFFIVSNLDSSSNVRALSMKNGDLFLSDTIRDWTNTAVSGGVLGVDGRFEVHLTKSNLIVANRFSSPSSLTHSTSNPGTITSIRFNHNNFKDKPVYYWETDTYNTYLNPSPSNMNIPVIYVDSVPINKLNVDFSSLPFNNFNVNLEKNQFLTTDNNGIQKLKILWTNHPLDMDINLNGKQNSIVQLTEEISEERTYNIRSTKNSNTIITLKESSPYPTYSIFTNSERIQFGNSTITCTPDRIVLDLLSQVHIDVNEIPGSAESIFLTKTTSSMTIQKSSGNMIVSNYLIDVVDNYLINHQFLLFVTGDSVVTKLRTNQAITYDGGCLVRSSGLNALISTWFHDSLTKYYPSEINFLYPCSLFSFNTKRLDVLNSPYSYLKNLNLINNMELHVNTGIVKLLDNKVRWKSVSLLPSSLRVDSLFYLTIKDGLEVFVDTTYHNDSQILYRGNNVNESSVWHFGCPDNSTKPLLNITAHQESNIKFCLDYIQLSTPSLSLNTRRVVDVGILSTDQTLPTDNTTILLNSNNLTLSQANPLITRTITTRTSKRNTCFLPEIQCTNQFWEDVNVLGKDAFMTKPLREEFLVCFIWPKMIPPRKSSIINSLNSNTLGIRRSLGIDGNRNSLNASQEEYEESIKLIKSDRQNQGYENISNSLLKQPLVSHDDYEEYNDSGYTNFVEMENMKNENYAQQDYHHAPESDKQKYEERQEGTATGSVYYTNEEVNENNNQQTDYYEESYDNYENDQPNLTLNRQVNEPQSFPIIPPPPAYEEPTYYTNDEYRSTSPTSNNNNRSDYKYDEDEEETNEERKYYKEMLRKIIVESTDPSTSIEPGSFNQV
ncbi:predicted protein [Naegleria gruberi]|uniref:Predicted protein n=1 Tax=Naegleria gruberi TaxID=5762 RepID=D2VX55_NAEGR|nr:uncharacterized protein NAEGRDRAFT_52947 [Naegleria gruberi]EFC38567.1 predicted protein [Naegleria gruberi]|eukprot:XP_002671311.1 predicted protein [Naegleria gruberi strain NEG-M]